jgi:hypothetical protein
MRDIPVTTINGVGITYDEVDVTALQDALKSVLAGQGSVSITLGGPIDTSAATTAATSGNAALLSGSHTVLSAIAGSNTARSLAIYIGIQQYWTTATDPVFGGVDDFICTDYTVDVAAGTYTSKFAYRAGTTAPAWGTAAIAAS